jgi:hypothetical protein
MSTLSGRIERCHHTHHSKATWGLREPASSGDVIERKAPDDHLQAYYGSSGSGEVNEVSRLFLKNSKIVDVAAKKRVDDSGLRISLGRIPAPCAHLVGSRVSRRDAKSCRGAGETNPRSGILRLGWPPLALQAWRLGSGASLRLCGSLRLCVKSGREAEGGDSAASRYRGPASNDVENRRLLAEDPGATSRCGGSGSRPGAPA